MYSAATKDIWRTVYAKHHHIFNFLTSVQSRKSNSSYLPSSTVWASGIRPLFIMTRWLIRSEMVCITQPRVQSQCNPGYKLNCLWWIFPFHADTSINTPVTLCRSHKGNPSSVREFLNTSVGTHMYTRITSAVFLDGSSHAWLNLDSDPTSQLISVYH